MRSYWSGPVLSGTIANNRHEATIGNKSHRRDEQWGKGGGQVGFDFGLNHERLNNNMLGHLESDRASLLERDAKLCFRSGAGLGMHRDTRAHANLALAPKVSDTIAAVQLPLRARWR
jgi:hypothetical protein